MCVYKYVIICLIIEVIKSIFDHPLSHDSALSVNAGSRVSCALYVEVLGGIRPEFESRHNRHAMIGNVINDIINGGCIVVYF